MREVIKLCTERFSTQKLALFKELYWDNGRILRVYFMDGPNYVRNKIIQYANEWTKYANIHFNFVNDKNAEIRISFKSDDSWSYIGTENLEIPKKEVTMNYGWFNEDTTEDDFSCTILHEFGHALGCVHEHQSPASNILWNKPVVYEYYKNNDPPWSKNQVDENIFNRYSSNITQYTKFDKKSIMLYAIPNILTIGDFSTEWNEKLSETDKIFINQIYPLNFQKT